MSQVDLHLGLVIEQWCGLEPGTYGLSRKLNNMWLETHPVSPAYDPTGIVFLLNRINNDSLFSVCERAQELRPGDFRAGGGVQTVRDLRNFLLPCGDSDVVPSGINVRSLLRIARARKKRGGNQ